MVETGRIRERSTENKKHNWSAQNRQGAGKNRIVNEEAKELLGMTHGQELKWGGCWRVGGGAWKR